MADTSQSEQPSQASEPQTNGLPDGVEEDEKTKMRPADIDADMREMERRKRVEMIMNSRLFREELERIIECQLKDGNGPAGLLQQISDMVGMQGGRIQSGNVFRSASCVVPINDIRGVESMGYAKGEKILRCKLAAVYRLMDLYGWSQGVYNHITARLNQDQEHFLVNPFGMLYHEITASSLVKIDMQGNIVESGTTNFGVNVTGFMLHAAIHAARPDIKCIIHVHTPSVLAVSSLKCGLLPLCQEAIVVGEISQHPYLGCLSEPEEREKIARNLGPLNKVMFLTNHGVVCCGETVEEAFFNVYNTVLACETQIKLMPMGVDNLVLVSDEARKQIYEAARRPPDSAIKQPDPADLPPSGIKKEKQWRVGGIEFEALMRMLDNAGFRTGYIYRHPLVKGEPPRPRNDVEVPPAVSSLGYLLEEEEMYKQGHWKKYVDGRKTHDRTRWLNSPNVYQKVEILETGTPDPKKITKWVDANAEEWVAEGSPTHSSTPVKIDCALQFVPKNTDPREFKKLQQQIKDNRRSDKITSGPQSHILEGVSWEEAKKLQDANISATGDQVILVGAASKGIIQRGFQHNALVYKTPYAKNPFDTITDEELEEYKKVIERKQRGESFDEEQSESEPLSSSLHNSRPTNEESVGALKSPLMSPTSAASETEEESRDEPRVLRIETKQVPRPSQAEVVLSDAEGDMPDPGVERTMSLRYPARAPDSPADSEQFKRTWSLPPDQLKKKDDCRNITQDESGSVKKHPLQQEQSINTLDLHLTSCCNVFVKVHNITSYIPPLCSLPSNYSLDSSLRCQSLSSLVSAIDEQGQVKCKQNKTHACRITRYANVPYLQREEAVEALWASRIEKINSVGIKSHIKHHSNESKPCEVDYKILKDSEKVLGILTLQETAVNCRSISDSENDILMKTFYPHKNPEHQQGHIVCLKKDLDEGHKPSVVSNKISSETFASHIIDLQGLSERFDNLPRVEKVQEDWSGTEKQIRDPESPNNFSENYENSFQDVKVNVYKPIRCENCQCGLTTYFKYSKSALNHLVTSLKCEDNKYFNGMRFYTNILCIKEQSNSKPSSPIFSEVNVADLMSCDKTLTLDFMNLYAEVESCNNHQAKITDGYIINSKSNYHRAEVLLPINSWNEKIYCSNVLDHRFGIKNWNDPATIKSSLKQGLYFSQLYSCFKICEPHEWSMMPYIIGKLYTCGQNNSKQSKKMCSLKNCVQNVWKCISPKNHEHILVLTNTNFFDLYISKQLHFITGCDKFEKVFSHEMLTTYIREDDTKNTKYITNGRPPSNKCNYYSSENIIDFGSVEQNGNWKHITLHGYQTLANKGVEIVKSDFSVVQNKLVILSDFSEDQDDVGLSERRTSNLTCWLHLKHYVDYDDDNLLHAEDFTKNICINDQITLVLGQGDCLNHHEIHSDVTLVNSCDISSFMRANGADVLVRNTNSERSFCFLVSDSSSNKMCPIVNDSVGISSSQKLMQTVNSLCQCENAYAAVDESHFKYDEVIDTPRKVNNPLVNGGESIVRMTDEKSSCWKNDLKGALGKMSSRMKARYSKERIQHQHSSSLVFDTKLDNSYRDLMKINKCLLTYSASELMLPKTSSLFERFVDKPIIMANDHWQLLNLFYPFWEKLDQCEEIFNFTFNYLNVSNMMKNGEVLLQKHFFDKSVSYSGQKHDNCLMGLNPQVLTILKGQNKRSRNIIMVMPSIAYKECLVNEVGDQSGSEENKIVNSFTLFEMKLCISEESSSWNVNLHGNITDINFMVDNVMQSYLQIEKEIPRLCSTGDSILKQSVEVFQSQPHKLKGFGYLNLDCVNPFNGMNALECNTSQLLQNEEICFRNKYFGSTIHCKKIINKNVSRKHNLKMNQIILWKYIHADSLYFFKQFLLSFNTRHDMMNKWEIYYGDKELLDNFSFFSLSELWDMMKQTDRRYVLALDDEPFSSCSEITDKSTLVQSHEKQDTFDSISSRCSCNSHCSCNFSDTVISDLSMSTTSLDIVTALTEAPSVTPDQSLDYYSFSSPILDMEDHYLSLSDIPESHNCSFSESESLNMSSDVSFTTQELELSEPSSVSNQESLNSQKSEIGLSPYLKICFSSSESVVSGNSSSFSSSGVCSSCKSNSSLPFTNTEKNRQSVDFSFSPLSSRNSSPCEEKSMELWELCAECKFKMKTCETNNADELSDHGNRNKVSLHISADICFNNGDEVKNINLPTLPQKEVSMQLSGECKFSMSFKPSEYNTQNIESSNPEYNSVHVALNSAIEPEDECQLLSVKNDIGYRHCQKRVKSCGKDNFVSALENSCELYAIPPKRLKTLQCNNQRKIQSKEGEEEEEEGSRTQIHNDFTPNSHPEKENNFFCGNVNKRLLTVKSQSFQDISINNKHYDSEWNDNDFHCKRTLGSISVNRLQMYNNIAHSNMTKSSSYNNLSCKQTNEKIESSCRTPRRRTFDTFLIDGEHIFAVLTPERSLSPEKPINQSKPSQVISNNSKCDSYITSPSVDSNCCKFTEYIDSLDYSPVILSNGHNESDISPLSSLPNDRVPLSDIESPVIPALDPSNFA